MKGRGSTLTFEDRDEEAGAKDAERSNQEGREARAKEGPALLEEVTKLDTGCQAQEANSSFMRVETHKQDWPLTI